MQRRPNLLAASQRCWRPFARQLCRKRSLFLSYFVQQFPARSRFRSCQGPHCGHPRTLHSCSSCSAQVHNSGTTRTGLLARDSALRNGVGFVVAVGRGDLRSWVPQSIAKMMYPEPRRLPSPHSLFLSCHLLNASTRQATGQRMP